MNIKEQMREALLKARAIASTAEAEQRDMTDAEAAEAAGHIKTYQGLKKQLDNVEGSAAVKAALDSLAGEGFERNDPDEKRTPEGFSAIKGFKTIGEMFVESAEYKGLLSQFPKGDNDRPSIPQKARVSSQPFGLKALVTGVSDTSGGAFVTNDRQADVEMLGRRPLTVRDLVSVRQTTSDTVEFVQQTTQMTSAAPVAEATTAAAPTAPGSAGALVLPAGGGYKPEGSIAFQVVTATVKTIAEWVPATKRALADAAQMRGLIDQELRDDLREEEEDQILNGNGTGENLTGILNTSGIQTQAAATGLPSGVDVRTGTALIAQTKVQTVGRAIPTGYLMNSADWEQIALNRLAKNPQDVGVGRATATLHGLPVVLSEAIAAGTALVGDFRKAVIWDRQQASITATDSHADFFIRNLVAILGEERLAFGVLRPKAFVRMAFA